MSGDWECDRCGEFFPEEETVATWTRATQLDPPEADKIYCLNCAAILSDGPDEGIIGDE